MVGVAASDAAAGDAAASDDAAGDAAAGDAAAGDAAAGDAAVGDDAAGDAAAGDAAAGDSEVPSELGLTKAPPAILALDSALSAPLALTLPLTSAEMDVMRSFHRGLPRNSLSTAMYRVTYPLYQVRDYVNSMENVQAAPTQARRM